jgi:hypothetical protein
MPAKGWISDAHSVSRDRRQHGQRQVLYYGPYYYSYGGACIGRRRGGSANLADMK